MSAYINPLSVAFLWHPYDDSEVGPIVDDCYAKLSRNIERPFSRSVNLPIFVITSLSMQVPRTLHIKSKKLLLFAFIGKKIVADDNWIEYIKNLKQSNTIVIPIALDPCAFSLNCFDGVNFIRAFEYKSVYKNNYIFIAIAHEIYRWTLNESSGTVGTESSLELFISHSKDEKYGIVLAKKLKEFIDNSSMNDFFDATDIAPGYAFNQEIAAHIEKSTIIAINSDIYSSRYWCQKEVLHAKVKDRPMIAVDILNEFEDRRFPYESNIPCVHVYSSDNVTEKDLLRIIEASLIETIRFFYAKILLNVYKKSGWIDASALVLSRPPDISDIDKLFLLDGSIIKRKHDLVIYPEPPLYKEELQPLINLGISICTPLSLELDGLNKRIGISISEPEGVDLVNIGLTNKHLIHLSQDITRHLLARQATLVYGGDLRKAGFTNFIFDEAQILKTRLQTDDIHIEDYIAWPSYKQDSKEVINWKSKYRSIAKIIEGNIPSDVKDLILSKDSFLPPNNVPNCYVWSRCLTEMRRMMIKTCNARICAGGRLWGYKGIMPGVLEEILLAIDMKCPIYLLGGFGGVTARVCQIIQNQKLPSELTIDFQRDYNPGYASLWDYCKTRDKSFSFDYNSLPTVFNYDCLNNGLTIEENNALFNTQYVDEAFHLIITGFTRLWT